MNRVMKAAAMGAAIGFFVMVCFIVFKVRSPLIMNLFWPLHFLVSDSKGGIWQLIFRLVGFFGNAFLYGLIGYGIGRLMYGKEEAERPPTETSG